MCEITKLNFEEKYSEVIDDLHSALYISVDCEFTGLFSDDFKCSLFDSPRTRFMNLQNCLEKYLIIQFGLSAFKYERKNNSFVASTYTFYLIPTPTAESKNFLCDIRSLDFLSKHNFDFNKVFYDGIYFLSKSDETNTIRMIEERQINPEYEKEIQMHCSAVNEWSVRVPIGSEMFLSLNNQRQTFICYLHQEIRIRFPKLWTYFEKDGIKIKKVNNLEKRDWCKEEIILKKKIFDSLLGFSRIMKELQALRKPIVGHNFLIDLLKIYQQFYNPSPVSYTKFKQAVNNLFPNVYDTKYMSFVLREKLAKDMTWNSNALFDLYQYFRNGKGASLVICTPVINHKIENYGNKTDFHNAGFDSYITGFCFLKMAHAFSLWSPEIQNFQMTSLPVTCSWLLGAVAPMKNKLHISRAQVNNIVLDGSDPKNIRPGYLYIQSKRNEALAVAKISQLIAKYGSADLQSLNKFSALLAVANRRQMTEILQSFQNTDEFVIHKYNFLKHSFLGKILPGVVIAFGTLATIFVLKKF